MTSLLDRKQSLIPDAHLPSLVTSLGREKPRKLWQLAIEKESRLILALDLYETPALGDNRKLGEEKTSKLRIASLMESLRDLVVAIKIGFPLLLSVGLETLSDLMRSFNDDYYFIADFKLSDIPEVNSFVVEVLAKIGFDGAIFQVFQGGLERTSKPMDRFALVMMSHPEAALCAKNFGELIGLAKRAKVEGLVVGATKLYYVRRARSLVPHATIISPGVITQGGEPSSALREGADFEIVGRAIINSEEPELVAEELVRRERDVLRG